MAATGTHLHREDLAVLGPVLFAHAKSDARLALVLERTEQARRRLRELKALRLRLGLSQRAAARACGIAQSTLSDAENGRRDHHLSTMAKWESGLRALAEQNGIAVLF